MRTVLVAACWGSVIVALIVESLGYVGSVGPATAVLVAATPLAVLPTVAAVVTGMMLRCWTLAVFGTAVLAATIGVPGSVPASRPPPPDSAVTIVSSNVRTGNPQIEELVQQVGAELPDVVMMQEIGPDDLREIRKTDLTRSHPHEFADPRSGFFGGAIFSRWPVTGRVEDVGGYPMIVATVETPTGKLDVINVHVAPPMDIAGYRLWSRQLGELGDRLRAAERPLVVIGDFNATEDHAELRALADRSSDRGLAPFRSFPFNAAIPSLLSLDHVFVSGGWCLWAAEGMAENPGSDHRAMRAVVAPSYSRDAACR